MDLADYNDVVLKLFDFEIICKGILRSANEIPVSVGVDGTITTHVDDATLETSGGTCRNIKTNEERIFPAGVYQLSKKFGIEQIREIEAE